MWDSTFKVIRDYYHLRGLKTRLWVRAQYFFRLLYPSRTRTENSRSHFCVYFLPYNPETKKVFLVLHKKAGIWLFPGGHMDKGETPTQTLKREVWEELGLILENWRNFLPFFLSITKIPKRLNTKCRKHFDIWYRIPTDGKNFNVDMNEFLKVGWFSIAEAREIATDSEILAGLDKMQEFFEKVS